MASSALLAQIQAGKALKKAQTNDRSAPVIETPKGSISGGGSVAPAASSQASVPSTGGPPQLGGLFAGGMPKLKPAGQSNAAKVATLGKPPSVPKRDAVATPPAPSATPARPSPEPPVRPTPSPTRPVPPPTRSVPVPNRTVSPPAPPNRTVPSLPSRTVPAPPVTQATSETVSRAIPSGISRPVPGIPPRISNTPTRSVPTTPGRAPPPPPARPSSAGGVPTKTPPAPPARRAVPPAPPDRSRPLSEVETAPKPPILPPGRPSLNPPSRIRTVSVPSPTVSVTLNGSSTRTKIPSPPPNAGNHVFPVDDFPPPRPFEPSVKHYSSGRQRGSDFDLGLLQ